MYRIYRVYLLLVLFGISVVAQEPMLGAEKPSVKQQSTKWSRVKKWGLYATGGAAVILSSYAIYKQTVGKKAASTAPMVPLTIPAQFEKELDSVKSYKVLDKKMKDFALKDEGHKEFAESPEGKLIYDQTKTKIESNIKEANSLVEQFSIILPQPDKYEQDPTYDTERYFNRLLLSLLHEKKPLPIILSHSKSYREFNDQHLAAFKILLDLGANAETASDGEIYILKSVFWKYAQDEGHFAGIYRPEQLPYDRELIKVLILHNAIRPEGPSLSGNIASVMEKDPELRKFFKGQGYSDDGIKYVSSWW
jgi:hypothetical protein